MRGIAICADDYAMSPAISAGILEALDAGRISATSAMANRPAFADMMPDLLSRAHRCDIGLHLNLTLGTPLGSSPDLASDGRFPSYPMLFRMAILGRIPRDEVAQEIARQFDRFEEVCGRTPDFVDGHQHVHVLPGIRRLVLAEMIRRNLAGRAWLRDLSDSPGSIGARRCDRTQAFGLAILSAGLEKEAGLVGISTNKGFSGCSRLDPNADFAQEFGEFLKYPGPRHLVMCHPGRLDPNPLAGDEVTLRRECEINFLLSARFPLMMKERHLTLTRLSTLLDDVLA